MESATVQCHHFVRSTAALEVCRSSPCLFSRWDSSPHSHSPLLLSLSFVKWNYPSRNTSAVELRGRDLSGPGISPWAGSSASGFQSWTNQERASRLPCCGPWSRRRYTSCPRCWLPPSRPGNQQLLGPKAPETGSCISLSVVIRRSLFLSLWRVQPL